MRFFFKPAIAAIRDLVSMLEKIREGSQGVIAQVILGLVILTFAVSGVSSYFTNSADQSVATVNGEEISRPEFEQALQNERARQEQQFGEMFSQLAANPEYMNKLRESVLDRLIDDELLKQQAAKLDITISDQFLMDAIRKMKEFEVDGVFNNDRYLALLRQNNLTANQFRDLMRDQYSRMQITAGLAGSEFALPSELKLLVNLQQQTRDFDFAVLKAADQASAVEISDEKLNTWYSLNQQRYATPEQLSLQYVSLKGLDLAKDIKVEDADVETYYNANLSRYQGEERRRVSHILLESAEENLDIYNKAAELLKLLQSGADFAELAKKNSSDTVSAENGGDLDFITKGIMDAEFETAAFALAKAGDLSGVVKSSFGYHIIKLTEVEAATVKPLAEVKEQIVSAVQAEKAAEKFADLQQKLATVSFEVADTLEDAAKAVGVKVQSTELFSKDNVPADLNFPAVLNVVFNPEFIEGQVNSEVIEVAPEQVVVARLIEHKAPKTRTFDEVKAEVQTAYVAEQSAELAKVKAEKIAGEIAAGKAVAEVIAAEKLTVEKVTANPRFGGAMDAQIRNKAFELAKPAEGKVSVAATALQSGDAALVMLNKVTEVPATTEPSVDELQGYASQLSQSNYEIIRKALRENAEIVKHEITAAVQE
jgi:peptidyl-prolyl cis-trans isomerase D